MRKKLWPVLLLVLVGMVASLLLISNIMLVLSSDQNQGRTLPNLNLPATSPISSPIQSPTSIKPIPSSMLLAGGTHVFQSFNNCGPSSLSMTLSLYQIEVGQQELGRELRPYQNPQGDNDDKSVTLAELAVRAQDFGFLTYHRPGGSVEILEQLIAHDMAVITRTWLKPEEDIGHFRVVKGYDQKRGILIQDDSLQGANLEYSYQDFLDLWAPFGFEFLVLVPRDKQAEAELILGPLVDENKAWESALAIADDALSETPSDVTFQLNRSVALYHLGEYDASKKAYEVVADQLPARTLWYQLEPILAYYQLGEYEEVMQISDLILNNQNRAYSELHYLRGIVWEQTGETELAKQAFELSDRYNTSSIWKINIESIGDGL